jgi:hypothetical protein
MLANVASYVPRRLEWYVRKMAHSGTHIIPPISRVGPLLKTDGEKGCV